MHNLAIALKRKGIQITGSDDEIFEPSKSRLAKEGILPDSIGWKPDMISDKIDAIILGMHARKDNPELLRAQELGLKIYSYPEFIYEQSKDKTRIVVGGSHGKTTITSMLLHAFKKLNVQTDFLVGALLEGFDCMVQLSDAKYIVIEGDEYLSSPIDLTPKFHWYAPHYAIISGIAWDHINVFPTFENYVNQFKIFTDKIQSDGTLVYYRGDVELQKMSPAIRGDIHQLSYDCPEFSLTNGTTYVHAASAKYALKIFGKHNLQNLNAARLIMNQLGFSDAAFYEVMTDFKGAAKRLELIAENQSATAYKDFAHSPSKLKATVAAVKEQFPQRRLIACMELHTFSSLKRDFLPQYKNCMEGADEAYVYFSPEVVKHKKLEAISADLVKESFATNNVKVFTSSDDLTNHLRKLSWQNANLLLMSSGNFDGVDLNSFAKELIF